MRTTQASLQAGMVYGFAGAIDAGVPGGSGVKVVKLAESFHLLWNWLANQVKNHGLPSESTRTLMMMPTIQASQAAAVMMCSLLVPGAKPSTRIYAGPAGAAPSTTEGDAYAYATTAAGVKPASTATTERRATDALRACSIRARNMCACNM